MLKLTAFSLPGMVTVSFMAFLMPCLLQQAKTDNDNIPSSNVLKIGKAEALVTNLNVVALNKSRGFLQLNISWKEPTEMTIPQGYVLPDKYNVKVILLNTSGICSEGSRSFANKYVNLGISNTVIPEFLLPGQSFLIKHECTYNITIEPEHFRGEATHKVYTVPKCVDICDCQPPLPEVLDLKVEQLPSGGCNATWRLAEDSSNNHSSIYTVKLKLGVYTFHSNQHNMVYVYGWTKEVNTKPATAAHITVPASQLILGKEHKVEATVVGTNKCVGPTASFSFREPFHRKIGKDSNSILQTQLFVVLLILSLCMLFFLTFAILWKRFGCRSFWKTRNGRMRPLHVRHLGVYKFNSDSHSMINFPVHQERNIIYVEQEIEDAKDRGDADKFEISYSRLVMGRQVGKGAFGRVFIAKADSIGGTPGYQTVAVKKLKNRATSDEVEEFLSEIAMLKKVGRHPNIVTLLGCCTLKEPFCMVMEYVPCGDLLQYLRSLRVEYERMAGSRQQQNDTPFALGAHRGGSGAFTPGPRYIDLLISTDSEGSYIQPESHFSGSGQESIPETEWSLLSSEGVPQTPTEERTHKLECVLDPKELQNFAVQIARGMAHLESKHITHRDLAARNVLIDENKTLKISDFGLSRTGIYINTKRKKVPLRWLSIEAMRDNLYSSKSDVWAFAIVLWEIGTLGGFPYPTVADMNLLPFLVDGKRLEKPDNCSDDLYSLMLRCWSSSPDARPSFSDLVQYLDSVICRKRVYVDFSHLSPHYTFPPTEQQSSKDIKKTNENQYHIPSTKSDKFS